MAAPRVVCMGVVFISKVRTYLKAILLEDAAF